MKESDHPEISQNAKPQVGQPKPVPSPKVPFECPKLPRPFKFQPPFKQREPAQKRLDRFVKRVCLQVTQEIGGDKPEPVLRSNQATTNEIRDRKTQKIKKHRPEASNTNKQNKKRRRQDIHIPGMEQYVPQHEKEKNKEFLSGEQMHPQIVNNNLYDDTELPRTIRFFDDSPSPPPRPNSDEEIAKRHEKQDTYTLARLKRLVEGYNIDARVYFEEDDMEDVEYDIPRLIVLVSPEMKRNYNRYGDLVTYDLMNAQNFRTQTNRLRVGVFAVNDNNMVVVMVGIAIMFGDLKQTTHDAFRSFFEIHRKLPRTFVTTGSKENRSALKRLNKQENLVSHIFNPVQVLNELPTKDQGILSEFEYFLKSIIDEKEESVLNEKLNSMKKKSPEISRLVDWLVEYRPSIMYAKTTEYVGLVRDNCEQLNRMFQPILMEDHPTKIMPLIRQILAFDKNITEASEKERVLKTPENEDQWSDERLKQSRRLIKLKVFYRLLENISRAYKYKQAEEKGFVKIVREIQDEEKAYIIFKDKCNCYEMERTGMACPHLIRLTMDNKKKRYEDLLAERWKVRTF